MLSDQQLRHIVPSDRVVALWGDVIRAVLLFVVLLIVALYLAYYAAMVRLMYADLHMNDFGKFYYSAQHFLAGEDMYSASPATSIPVGIDDTRQFWNMNPPHFHLIILPFAVLSPAWALTGWAAVNLLCLVASAAMIGRTIEFKWTAAATFWVVVGTIACSITGTNIVTGQLSFLLMLPLTAAWLAAREGRWSRAACLLGIAASVKPFLGLFALYFVLTKRWRPIIVMAGTIAASLVVGVLVFGVSSYRSWIGVMSSVEWIWAPMNASIAGILARAATESPFYTQLVDAPAAARVMSSVVSLAVAVASLWMCVRDRSPTSVDRTFAILLVTALVVSPLGWVYYLCFAAGPTIALLRTARRRPSSLRNALLWLATPGLLWPLLWTMIWRDSRWAGITVGSIYGWTALIIWSALVVDWRVRDKAVS